MARNAPCPPVTITMATSGTTASFRSPRATLPVGHVAACVSPKSLPAPSPPTMAVCAKLALFCDASLLWGCSKNRDLMTLERVIFITLVVGAVLIVAVLGVVVAWQDLAPWYQRGHG